MLHSDDGISGDQSAPIGNHMPWPAHVETVSTVLSWLTPPRVNMPLISSPGEGQLLINVLKRRLLAAAQGDRHPLWTAQSQAWMQALVQDCDDVLAQLQVAWEQEHARRWKLEVQAFDTRADLARLRAELAGSRAGELRARHQALHDGLTTLPNRHYFRLRLDQAIEASSRMCSGLAVFFVDLDDFKAVNDVHGHAAGDELLGIVAARLTRAIRSDDVVGRLGGDEFACLLMGMHDRQQLSRLACKAYDTVAAPVKLGELVISVRPSIGVAVLPECGATGEALLQRADMAMYKAKREQTGYAFFEDGDDTSA